MSDFERARRNAIAYLLKMAAFSVTLNDVYPRSRFSQFHRSLTGVANKLKGSVRPNLTQDDFDKLDEFRAYLVNFNRVAPKLRKFNSLCVEIANAEFFENIRIIDSEKVVQEMNRYVSVGDLTSEVMQAIQQDRKSILSIMSAMMLFISRKETFYHGMKSILQNAIKVLHLEGYDIEDLCSVHSKVGRRNKNGVSFETDVEVLRNCISHVYYKVSESKVGYSVRFERHDMGYDFIIEFAGEDFIEFFENFYLLELTQSVLILVNLNQAMMMKYLSKQE